MLVNATTGLPASPGKGETYEIDVYISGESVAEALFSAEYDYNSMSVQIKEVLSDTIMVEEPFEEEPGVIERGFYLLDDSQFYQWFTIVVTPETTGSMTLDLHLLVKDRSGNDITPEEYVSYPVHLNVTDPDNGEVNVTYDLSGIPANPVIGESYRIPVNISGGDITCAVLKAKYDKSSVAVSFENTSGVALGGYNGLKTLYIYTGTPLTFDLVVTPYSKVNDAITLNLLDADNREIVPPYQLSLYRKQVTYSGGIVPDEYLDYIPNNETGIMSTSEYPVPIYRPAASGYIFRGYDNDGEFVAPGDQLTIAGDTHLVAQWTPLEDGFTPSLNDVVLLSRMIVTGTNYDEKYDLNNDGECDIFDLVLMAQYVADHF